MNNEKISFIIGFERDDGSIESYSFSGEVQFDTLKEAKNYCRYANRNNSENNRDKAYSIYGLIKIDL